MYAIDNDVSVKVATRAERVAIHSANLGRFVKAGISTEASSRPKVPTKFVTASDPRNKHGTADRAPLSLDPLFRSRMKGDSKAHRINGGKPCDKRGPGKPVHLLTAKKLKPAKPPQESVEA